MAFPRMDCSGYGLQVIHSPVVQKENGEHQQNLNGKVGHLGQSSSHIVGLLVLEVIPVISNMLRNMAVFVFVETKIDAEESQSNAIECLSENPVGCTILSPPLSLSKVAYV